jgi:hypothetical protein
MNGARKYVNRLEPAEFLEQAGAATAIAAGVLAAPPLATA